MSLAGTVTDAAQRVQIGAADAALVWDATARQFGLDVVEVPLFQQKGVEQATLGVSAATPRPTAALHFARYLTARDRGEKVFAQVFFSAARRRRRLGATAPRLVLMSGAMLKPAIEDLLKQFQQREGVDINTIYNGCGILVAQMKTMQSGQNSEQPVSRRLLLLRRLLHEPGAAMVRRRGEDLPQRHCAGGTEGQSAESSFHRGPHPAGIADRFVPPHQFGAGALCDNLLKKLNLRDKVYAADRPRPIPQPSAGHELINEMRAGALDLIMVYRSNVLSSEKAAPGDLEIVEMNLPEAIAIQPFAVAKNSQHKYLMRRLLAAILSPETQKHFADVGFQWIAEETSP